MATESTRASFHPAQAQAETELLKLILDDEIPYPWNPFESEADAYFADLEQTVAAEWTPEELSRQGQALASQFDQLWVSTLQPVPEQADTLKTLLLKQFSSQVPQQLLESIAQRAQQLVAANLSVADRMVQCVQDLIPGWEEEDLRVMARPFAFAMRSNETAPLEVALRSIRCTGWAELSGVEQAKLSLAVARYAIAQLPATEISEP